MIAKTDQVTRKNKTMQRRTKVNNPTICGTATGGGTNRCTHLGKLRLLAIAIGAQAFIAHQGLAATLDHMSYTTLPGNQQQIAFKLSDPVNDPQTFQIDQPARIAIDLMGTTNALDKRIVPVGVGNLESVSIVEANDRTRVVLNLEEMTDYQTEIDGDRLLVTLDSDAQGEDLLDDLVEDIVDDVSDSEPLNSEPLNSELLIAAALEGTPEADEDTLTDDDLLSEEVVSEEELWEVAETLPLDDDSEEFDSEEVPNDGLVVELPSSLPLDFEAPESESSSAEVDINVETGAPIEEYVEQTPAPAPAPTPAPAPRRERVSYQADSGIDYSRQESQALNPPSPGVKKVVYSGEELSLNFQDIEIRSVLQLLADFTDLNIVVSDSVSGKLTLRLKNVPWDQALDIILRTKGLDKRRSGNVVMVAPAGEIAAQETAEREAAQQAIALEPLRTEFVQVNYAKANEVAAILKSETGGVLTERGNVTIDDRTNTILVNDTAEVLGKVRALVTRLDIPVRQVLIESRIVIANDDFNRELGSRFGVSRDTTNNDGEGVIFSGNQDAVTNLANNADLGLERFNVNLPAVAPSGSLGLAFAKLPFGTLLELELSAMQAEGRGEVISTPRVITANQREAYIEQGVEIPFQEAASSGATSTSFRKAVLGLRVKPQITPDERIIMDLTVNKDTVGTVVNGVPSIDTREVNTQVLVANGETVVLGGIYEQSTNQQREQVPFFGDLPLVGKLFQNNLNSDEKSELLVFVTPKIVNDGTSTLDR